MALLTELDKIERDSTETEMPPLPLDEEGEIDTDHPDFAAITARRSEITAARQLRVKVRSLIVFYARELISGATVEIEGQPWPADPSATNNAIGWAQRVLGNPDAMLPAAFRVALYNGADGQVAFILALGSQNTQQIDDALRAAFASLLPLLAKGMQPGR